MKPYHLRSWAVVTYCAVLIFLLVTYPSLAGASQNNPDDSRVATSGHAPSDRDPLTRSGFEHFYNMQYDPAIRNFEAVVQKYPDDPFAVNHLASALMWREMYRIGALDTELYAKEAFLTSRESQPDPKAKERIKDLFDRAQSLAEKRLKANPNDTDALFARGMSRAMRATYMGVVEKAWFPALRSAVGARKDHERVLQLDPNYTDAKFVVGVHNYVMGSLSWAVKIGAALVGLSGNRQKGIQYLYEAVNAGGETSVDARIALSLFLRREQRYKEAITLVEYLTEHYPHNYLAALEHANLLNAAGHGPEAISAYRKLLHEGDHGRYPSARLEQAAWGLGEALRGQHDFSGAAQAYDSVLTYKNVNPELRDRSNVASGEMYDLLNERTKAVQKYQAVIAASSSSPHAEVATKRLKKPYQLPHS